MICPMCHCLVRTTLAGRLYRHADCKGGGAQALSPDVLRPPSTTEELIIESQVIRSALLKELWRTVNKAGLVTEELLMLKTLDRRAMRAVAEAGT